MGMKIQDIDTVRGTRYILLDNNYKLIEEANEYLKYLDNSGKSPNAIRHFKCYKQPEGKKTPR